MTALQQDMLTACTSGNVTTLQCLLENHNIEKGSKPIYISTPDDPPPTNDLLEAAITGGKLEIVAILLQTYPSVTLYGGVITALVNHPDLAILDALYNHDKSIVQFEWDDHVSTFITEACKQPPEKIAPLLLFLVEHDAALDVGGLPHEGAITAALSGDQPLHVIEAMLKKEGPVTNNGAKIAIARERADVIEAFIRFGVERKPEDAQGLRTAAEETENTDIVKLVGTWTDYWGHQSQSKGSSMVRGLKKIFQK